MPVNLDAGFITFSVVQNLLYTLSKLQTVNAKFSEQTQTAIDSKFFIGHKITVNEYQRSKERLMERWQQLLQQNLNVKLRIHSMLYF